MSPSVRVHSPTIEGQVHMAHPTFDLAISVGFAWITAEIQLITCWTPVQRTASLCACRAPAATMSYVARIVRQRGLCGRHVSILQDDRSEHPRFERAEINDEEQSQTTTGRTELRSLHGPFSCGEAGRRLNRTIPMHRDIELRDQALRLRGERSAVRNTK